MEAVKWRKRHIAIISLAVGQETLLCVNHLTALFAWTEFKRIYHAVYKSRLMRQHIMVTLTRFFIKPLCCKISSIQLKKTRATRFIILPTVTESLLASIIILFSKRICVVMIQLAVFNCHYLDWKRACDWNDNVTISARLCFHQLTTAKKYRWMIQNLCLKKCLRKCVSSFYQQEVSIRDFPTILMA